MVAFSALFMLFVTISASSAFSGPVLDVLAFVSEAVAGSAMLLGGGATMESVFVPFSVSDTGNAPDELLTL